MKALASTLLILLWSTDQVFSQDRCEPEDLGRIRLSAGPRDSKNEGAVQICSTGFINSLRVYYWDYITTDGWADIDASVACRELGLYHTAAIAMSVTLSSQAYVVNNAADCDGREDEIDDCLPDSGNFQQRQIVAGIICKCTTREIRLVDGANYREGRVEVCVDGRWGTVCGEDWTEEEARLVCGRLGFLREGSTSMQFGEGTGPIYDCSSGTMNCRLIEAPSNCTHSNDAGVMCLGVDATMSASSNCGLGAVTGLSIIALIAVVAGWIGTCVYMWRKNNRFNSTAGRDSSSRQRHLDNPVYDGSTGPAHLQTNYSSVDPAYEPVNANQGIGYDVINRGGAPRPHPPVTPTGLRYPTSDQPYSVLDPNQDEHNYHVLESSDSDNNGGSVQRGTVQNEYETTNPQDYEIPT